MTRAVRPLLALALAPLLAGFSPFEAEQPDVRAGNERLAAGDAAGALPHYDAAERAVGPRAEIDFDRGNALAAQGRLPEARAAWERALAADARGPGTLSSRTLQNLGTALAAAGDREGAVRAFSEALRRDPANEDARYNLEVLQRRKDRGKGKPEDEGQDQARRQGPPEQGQGQPQPRQDRPPEQAQQQTQGEQRKPGDDRQGQRPDEGQDERRPAGEDERQGRGKDGAAQAEERPPAADGQRPEAIGRQEAEKLLDAMRARERNMPTMPEARKAGRKREVQRDW